MLVVNAVLLVGFTALHPGSAEGSTFRVIGNLTMVVPILACFAYAVLGGRRRAAAIWLGLAMLSQTAGNVIYTTWTQYQAQPPVPSASDFAYWGFYVCVVAAIVCLARRDHGSFPRALWLDGALGAAGAATALAAAMSPVLTSTHANLETALVGATYTAGDLLIVALVCGLLAVRGTRGGSMWLWIAGGLAIFCAADVVYALRVNAGTYEISVTLAGMWAIGVTCIAIALWQPHRPREIASGRSKAILAIPMLATLTAVTVLVISSFEQLATPVRGARDLHAAARRRANLHQLPAGPAPLRRPPPGRHRRPHRAREPARAVRARRRAPAEPRSAASGSR